MSFFNINGRDCNVAGLDLDSFLPLDAADEERVSRAWVSVEELTSHEPFNDEPEHFDSKLEMTYWSSPFLGDDYHYDAKDDRPGIAILVDGTCIILESSELQNNETFGFRPLDRFANEDPDESPIPSFSSNHEKLRVLSWNEGDLKWGRKWRNRHSKDPANFRIDGKLARKDNRNHRVGNRQEFAELRDYWSDVYDICEEINLEMNRPMIPTFEIEVVGMTNEEASRYEAEYLYERDCYIRELEMASWYDDFGYYDQYCDDDRGLDLDIDEPDFEREDFGPTLEEWMEHDRNAFEQMLEEEADRFAPSFVGSGRANLRYHISEPRRGKLKRKYGTSSSFFYRYGRPYIAKVAHH